MATDGISLRLASPDEWETIKALRIRSVREHPEAFGQTEKEAEAYDETKWRSLFESGQYLIAELNGEIVGMVCLVRETREKIRHYISIASMYVVVEAQGKGIGKALMQRAIAVAKSIPGVIKVTLHVTASQTEAKSMYTSLGFVEVGVLRKEMFVNGTYFDTHVMELMLS